MSAICCHTVLYHLTGHIMPFCKLILLSNCCYILGQIGTYCKYDDTKLYHIVTSLIAILLSSHMFAILLSSHMFDRYTIIKSYVWSLYYYQVICLTAILLSSHMFDRYTLIKSHVWSLYYYQVTCLIATLLSSHMFDRYTIIKSHVWSLYYYQVMCLIALLLSSPKGWKDKSLWSIYIYVVEYR